MMAFFRTYIVPGLIFQSVIVGGGYATGRELIEFFMPAGPAGGLLGLLVAGAVFGIVMALGFELARISKAYDYRSFTRALLGRAWVIYEIAYVALLLLVLSVITSAAGLLVADMFQVPSLFGSAGMVTLVLYLVYGGAGLIKQALAAWSILLYAVYITLFLLVFNQSGAEISETFAGTPVGETWFTSGFLYAGYNLAILPAVLFAVVSHTSRRQTMGAGLLAGLLGVVPAILFFTAMMSQFPAIVDHPVPSALLIQSLDLTWLSVLFQIVVFGTFVETGSAMLHAVNERIAGTVARPLPPAARAAVAAGFLAAAIFLAEAVGIIDLIASGYCFLTLVFLGCLILPLLTLGAWRIFRAPAKQAA